MANSQTVMAMIRLARPPFRNKFDKIAFAIHSSFIASGYILTATGRPAFADDALSSSSQNDVGIDGWNEFDGEYAFVYANPLRTKKILVKCLGMDDKLLVDAIAKGGSEPAHLEIKVDDYAQENNEEGDYAKQFKDLDKLVHDFQCEILSKLEGIPKPVSSSTQSSSERNEEPSYYGFRPNPYGPQIHPSGVVIPPIPISGGFSDLHPGPGAGMDPRRGDFGDGSMFVGPNDPRFFPIGGGSDRPGFMGPPQPGMPPPGARFDPIGPPDVPGFEPGRFTRQPPRGPGGGHPDLEHFPGGSDFI